MSFIPPLADCILANFHRGFQGGDTAHTFTMCAECGGVCEYSQASPLLPGETEFMARQMGESVISFRTKYLDGIRIHGKIIDVLKCTIPCVFLNSMDYSCEVRSYKPIMCLIYPLVFIENKDRWLLVCIDDSCPLARHPESRSYFEAEGKILVEKLRLHISDEWLCRATKINFNINFSRMLAEREYDIQKYQIYSLEKFLSFRE